MTLNKTVIKTLAHPLAQPVKRLLPAEFKAAVTCHQRHVKNSARVQAHLSQWLSTPVPNYMNTLSRRELKQERVKAAYNPEKAERFLEYILPIKKVIWAGGFNLNATKLNLKSHFELSPEDKKLFHDFPLLIIGGHGSGFGKKWKISTRKGRMVLVHSLTKGFDQTVLVNTCSNAAPTFSNLPLSAMVYNPANHSVKPLSVEGYNQFSTYLKRLCEKITGEPINKTEEKVTELFKLEPWLKRNGYRQDKNGYIVKGRGPVNALLRFVKPFIV